MSENFRKYIKRDPPTHLSIKFRCAKLHRQVDPATGETTYHHNTIYDVFKWRGWKETDIDKGTGSVPEYKNDWHIFWADKEWVHCDYDKVHLEVHQRVNHFRNHYELTRKDLLIKNLKRLRRQLEKEGKWEEETMNITPITFVLPMEYAMFVDEFRKSGAENPKKKDGNCWIMKPVGRSQGSGIFLMNKLSQIQQWRPTSSTFEGGHGPPVKKQTAPGEKEEDDSSAPEVYVVQRYVENPMLVGGKKFDLRLYVLVTSYQPLTVYMYREGFCRFSLTRFSMANIRDSKNAAAHLTNIAVQKQTLASRAAYQRTGAKWSMSKFKQYLLMNNPPEKVNALMMEIENVIIHSLLSVQKIMINDKHCFELYGFDILLDSNFKPQLIEVNASPSLTANTQADADMKFTLLDDVLTIIDVEKYLDGTERNVGGFRMIYYDNQRLENDSGDVFTSILGTNVDRNEEFKKLAKERASKLNPAEKKAAAAADVPQTQEAMMRWN